MMRVARRWQLRLPGWLAPAPRPTAVTATLPRPVDAAALTPGLPESVGALTAAVSTVTLDGSSWRDFRFGDRAWQIDAWRLYDITGQLRFVANWAGHSVSRCRLFVAEVDEQGEAGAEVEDPDVAVLASGPLGAGPAKDEALRLLGINLFIPGECYIVAEADGIGPGEDRWWVVSGSQIKNQGGQVRVKRSQLQGGGWHLFRPGVDLMLRVWTPHPRDTDEPDSPARSAIPDLREIEALRKREFAELDSRLAGAGVLVVPEGVGYPRGPDDPPGLPGFSALLGRAMAASLIDRSSPEALVPIMFEAPPELIEKFRHITFWTDLSDKLLPMRKNAIESLAQSLDIPPEVMLGLGSSNHWSAWAISEEAVTTQIVPLLSRIADALTTGYLRPALQAMGLDPGRYVYAFDTAPLTTRPNRAADALAAHDKFLISDDAARDAGAWTPATAPDQQEVLRRIVQAAATAAPSLVLGDPVLRAILGIEGTPPAAPAETSPPAEPETESETTGPPPTQPNNTETPPAGEAAAVMAVAHMAVLQALRLAGSRMVPHRDRDRFPNTPRHRLHLHRPRVTATRAEELLRGAWEELDEAAVGLPVPADELAAALHEYTCTLLTQGMAHDRVLLADSLARLDRRREMVPV